MTLLENNLPGPFAVNSVVTPISAEGDCPSGCVVVVNVEVTATSPDAPGMGFGYSLAGTAGYGFWTTSVQGTQTEGGYVQTVNMPVPVEAACGTWIEAVLYVNPGLGFLPVAGVDLLCSSCP